MSWMEYLPLTCAIAVALVIIFLGSVLHYVWHGLVLALYPFLPGISMDSEHQDPLSNWKGPRKVTLQRRANGFGFTLRHFIVYPPESAVAELNRLQETGGDGLKQKSRISALEPMDTIFVKQVKSDGPAHQAGLANGDRIVSVNGESVTGKTYQQVVNLIQLCDTNLTLFVVPREEDILQVAYPSSAYKAVNQTSKQTDRKTSLTPDQGRKETEYITQNSNVSSMSDDNDVVVVGKGVECEDTESVKERTDLSYVTDATTYRVPDHRGQAKPVTSTPNSDVYHNEQNERKITDSRQQYKVQRVTASTISHDSAGPMKVTLVNPSSGESSHGTKEQRTFRLTNVLNSQISSKQPNSLAASETVSGKVDSREQHDTQPQRHVASLKSYYEAAKLANSSQLSNETADTSASSTNRGYSSSVDNLLSTSGFSPAQAVLRVQPQRGINGSSSCDDLCNSAARSDIGRLNRQVSIINGQSVQRADGDDSPDGSMHTWKNDQESVKVSRSTGLAKITLRVDDPEVHKAFSHEASLQGEEYSTHATRVTVSASVSADNLSQNARNINVSPKREPRRLTVGQDSKNIPSSTSNALVPISRSQTLASGRVVHLSNQHQLLPDKPQDGKVFWDKKPSSTEHIDDLNLTVSDGSFFPWKRTGSRRGSCDSDGSGGSRAATNSQGMPKPAVPKRDSSRGRLRERSLEREKQREKTMREKHRSRSYDRAHQRTNWSQFQACRKNATGALPEGIQLDDGTLMPPGRKDSSASSNSAGSTGEKESKMFPAFSFKSLRPRSTSFDTRQERPRTWSDSGIFRFGSWSAKRGSGGKIKEKTVGGSVRRLLQKKEGQSGRQRLVRRTSYLRATGSDGEEEEEHGDSGSVTSSQEGDRPSREKITPKRNASIRKLKSFFGEGTPKIVEAQHSRRPSMIELLGTGPVAKEGPLNIKLAPNRSWKPVWAVLKGQVNKLFLMKEQRDQTQHLSLLEQPISLNGSNVDIAYDYTKKKKNVIRLTNISGMNYLLQVSDTETMLAWIKAIQENNDPDLGEKENNLLQLLDKSSKGDTQPGHQGKVPSPSSYRKKFFNKSPGTQPKPRPTAREEMLAKAKASQSFADRMKRHIRGRGRTGGYAYPLDDPMIGNATFGVPLEECTASQSNELVPMVVEICCSIIEAKGMDFVGIYRVPGNSGGISYLKEELKKGVDEIDLTDERWQDVNVISSLLKLFFRKLPNPLVPNNQYKDFIAANRMEEPSERMWALRRQIHNLGDHHYESFKYLANHLKGVAANVDVNRMEVRNLAIVFGPTLVRSGDDSMVTMVTDMSDQCKIVESLILHCDWFFSDDVESQQDVPSDAMRLNSWDKKKAARRKGEDEEDGGDEEENEMDKTGPLKTSSMEDVRLDGGLFSSKDLILSVNAAAQRKMKSPNKPFSPDKMDTSEVKYRRPSPEPPQLHTIKLHDQESLRLNVGQQPITIDIGDERSLKAAGLRKDDNTGKVVLRQNSQGSVDSKSSCGSDENPKEMEALLPGSLFGSSNRSYQRSYYQNFQFGSTRGRKLSDSSDNTPQLNLEQELKSLTNATSKRDSWVQSDYSKERERIERQHAEALRDLEKEDNTNIEELFKSRDYLSELADVSNKIMDYTRKGVESPSASRKHSLEKISVRDHSKSSNNNNAFVAKVVTVVKEETVKKQLSTDSFAPLHIDEIDLDSDFVQSMKATFEERLQRVLQHESEDDSSRPTSLIGERDAHHHGDEPRGVHYRSNSVDRCEVLRRRLESPASSGSSSNTNSPVRSKDSTKSPARSKMSKSPSHSPKKCSRIEVILTMEKRETTPTSLRDNITNNAQEVSKTRRGSTKDAASIKERNREKRRRRHTVGGGKDLQKAISEHLESEESKKVSAVDRLKPFGKENLKSASKPQDIKSWLESERHRSTTSSPNLVSTVQASIARLHPTETDKQRKEKELRRKSTPILGATDFNEAHKLSRMPRYFEIESYL